MCSLELLVVALLACCVGITLGTPTPTDIHIGGIFNVWNKDKSLITQGQEALAAFLLAIKEINNKTDGIYDNMLQGYRLTPAIGRDATDYVGAVQEAFDMDALTLSPVAIVSSLTDITAVAATNVLETVEAVHLITHATTAELSKGTTASLLVNGKKLGLFPEGSSIFGHSQSASAETIKEVQALDPSKHPDYYFPGFMSFQPAPDYGLQVTDFGKDFVKRFAKQPNTYTPLTSSCDSTPDYRGQNIFDRSPAPAPAPTPYPCGGLDFSAYASGAKTVDDYTGNVYDAVWALGFALHDILITQGIPQQDFEKDAGNLLMQSFMNVRFVGATDIVSFNQGLRVNGRVTAQKLGYGDRDSGFTYLPVNYNPEADKVGNWAPVGRWDAEGDWQLCDEHLASSLSGPLVPCSHQVVYNTADGKRPRDRHPDVILRMPEALNGLFIALGSLSILMLLAASIYLYIHRDTQLVKSSQPPMMAMVLTGEALLSIRIILASIVNLDTKGSEWLCVSHLWFGHLGVCLFGPKILDLYNEVGVKRLKLHDVKSRVFGSKNGAASGAGQSWLGGGATSQAVTASMSESFSRAERKLVDACSAALHGFSLDERFMMCQRQLEYWRTMLVAVEEKRSSDTGSGSGGSSSAAASSVFKRDSSGEDTQSETELVSQATTFRPKPRRGSQSELNSVLVADSEEEEEETEGTVEIQTLSKAEEGV